MFDFELFMIQNNTDFEKKISVICKQKIEQIYMKKSRFKLKKYRFEKKCFRKEQWGFSPRSLDARNFLQVFNYFEKMEIKT